MASTPAAAGTILIAVGNSLRRDDGIAHRVLEMLAPLPAGATARSMQQLGPEVAEFIKDCDRVLVLDADIHATEPRLIRMEADSPPPRNTFGHVMPAGEVVALARLLYGFSGAAWICSLPAFDLEHGDVLSPDAHAAARGAAVRIREWMLEG